MAWYHRLFGGETESAQSVPRIAVESLPAVGTTAQSGIRYVYDDGEKYSGGYGPVEISFADYWALRSRSADLFRRNHYARGIVSRLVGNVIATGLKLEATPETSVLGFAPDALIAWSDEVEVLFDLWSKNREICDHVEQRTFRELQAVVELESMICGDVLCVFIQDRRTGLPRLRIVDGSCVRTPLDVPAGSRVVEGVELDAAGRHVAYWVVQESDKLGLPRYERLPSADPGTGRVNAWLYYGGRLRRANGVRGEPLLGCVLQSLKEVDRYRDATLRKAVLNGILAAFVERTQDKPASGGLGLGSIQRSTEQGSLSSSGNTVSGDAPLYQAKEFLPGLTLTNLQVGETIKAHGSTGTDEKFGEFEAAILSSVAWSLGVPPEVMRMSFGSNYSASKAAIQEFGFILEILRMGTGEGFCQPVYREFVISLALLRRVAMPGFLEAWRDRGRWETTAAWLCTAWSGQVKPSLDLGKSIGAYGDAIDRGFITHEQATKELFGGRWDRNVDKLKRELVRIRDAVGDGEDLA